MAHELFSHNVVLRPLFQLHHTSVVSSPSNRARPRVPCCPTDSLTCLVVDVGVECGIDVRNCTATISTTYIPVKTQCRTQELMIPLDLDVTVNTTINSTTAANLDQVNPDRDSLFDVYDVLQFYLAYPTSLPKAESRVTSLLLNPCFSRNYIDME